MSRAFVVLALCLGLLGPAAGQEPADPAADAAALEQVTRQVLARMAPLVVEVEALGGLPEEFKAPESEEEAQAQGGVLAHGGFKQAYGPSTGVILSADGLIVTSTFVLNRNPRHLFVTLQDGRSFVAKLLGRDDTRGLALLQIQAQDLPVPQAAPRAEIRVGQWSLALGRGLGVDQPSVSRGIVSAVDRIGGRAIQSSAAISPANYGGPLVDLRGRVQGILVPLNVHGGMASVDFYDSGIGFAIPLEDVQALVERLRQGAHLQTGVLGVVPDASSVDGIRVTEVVPDSPADAAGIWKGDVILSVDGQATQMAWQLRRALARHYAGEVVEITLRRGTKEWQAQVTLRAPAEQPQ